MSAANGTGASKERFEQQAIEQRRIAAEAEAKIEHRVGKWYRQLLREADSATKTYETKIAAFKFARTEKDYTNSLSFLKEAEASLKQLSEALRADQELHWPLQRSYGYDISRIQNKKESLEEDLMRLEERWANELFEQGKREAAKHHANVCNKLLDVYKETSYLFYLKDVMKILKRYDNNARLKAIRAEINRRLRMKAIEKYAFFAPLAIIILFFLIFFTALFPVIPLIVVTTLLSSAILAPFLIWLADYIQGRVNKMTPEGMKIDGSNLLSSQLTNSGVEPAASESIQAATLLPSVVELDIKHSPSVALNAGQQSQPSSAASIEIKDKTS